MDWLKSVLDWIRPAFDWMWPVAERVVALISGPRTRPVADSNSVVTDRTIKNIKGKKFKMAVETVSDAGSGPSGKAGGEVAQADCSARGGSVICTDRISDVHVDGDIDVSVTVKPKGTVDETLPDSQAKKHGGHPIHLQSPLHPGPRVPPTLLITRPAPHSIIIHYQIFSQLSSPSPVSTQAVC
ncbi:uncharacterized protein LOC120569614 isoform X5 [Perca fluviatilis]|uniref:uncharacterized protein LOC120569614 isoform X5 n=1 Tax=Perca fluviatilis TaxID=8168 RepID=UPI00196330D3|nr:uncharacterized protein LOC120569614 isoform X5 [Perca fluviatilis]